MPTRIERNYDPPDRDDEEINRRRLEALRPTPPDPPDPPETVTPKVWTPPEKEAVRTSSDPPDAAEIVALRAAAQAKNSKRQEAD
eukprot:293338-Prorocentrum_lima.AAC.1